MECGRHHKASHKEHIIAVYDIMTSHTCRQFFFFCDTNLFNQKPKEPITYTGVRYTSARCPRKICLWWRALFYPLSPSRPHAHTQKPQ